MKMTIAPRQIITDHDGGYLNMMSVGAGGIGVWTSQHAQPTYLLEQNGTINFVTFASKVWADEWFEEYGHAYKVVWKSAPGGQNT